ncbi:AAA family ATPase, partial [Pseudomonas viridiflava]|uniref:AAA family ATPase n=1 Tax=Pseudomonas viridiflava TaxID=33069 RepID=UPI0013DB4F93
NKAPYRFQNLSSEFSSLLAIYANLIMKVELRDISPAEMYGLVFIDEIDAHLHVSLQRKVLLFLTEAFPNIQFIITTHSPFVVSSVNNAVIYDMSTLQQVDDLSMYS